MLLHMKKMENIGTRGNENQKISWTIHEREEYITNNRTKSKTVTALPAQKARKDCDIRDNVVCGMLNAFFSNLFPVLSWKMYSTDCASLRFVVAVGQSKWRGSCWTLT